MWPAVMLRQGLKRWRTTATSLPCFDSTLGLLVKDRSASASTSSHRKPSALTACYKVRDAPNRKGWSQTPPLSMLAVETVVRLGVALVWLCQIRRVEVIVSLIFTSVCSCSAHFLLYQSNFTRPGPLVKYIFFLISMKWLVISILQ